MSQPALVKAVGFAFFSPEVFILFANHTQDYIQLYPRKSDLTFPHDKRRHIVALRALEKLSHLEQYADQIDLLVIFADAAELLDLGIPLMDGELDEDGRVVGRPRQNRDELFSRIHAEAVDLTLTRTVPAIQHARRKAKETAAYDGPTFRAQMRSIRDAVKDASGFSFLHDAGIPAVLRLMGDTSRDDFKAACRGIIKHGNASEELVKSFFKWTEGIDGGVGPELGKAVDALLYSDSDVEQTEEEIAEKYGVDAKDVGFVASTYKQLQDTAEETDDSE